MPKIIVDADACPVKAEINQLAKDFQLEVIYVASYNHYRSTETDETWIYVDTEKESADIRIVNLAQKGDIIVTQDIGLASMLLTKCIVFSNRGEIYLEERMTMMLEQRNDRRKERKLGKYSKGPKAMTDQDYIRFYQNVRDFLENKVELTIKNEKDS
ncbi:YaiI/YqxD family protein [Listeria goaensis]|uniref:YaiI/YqxD family protein n=1 Tax=Listeria goaensis TaxID=1649188 RepID=UPI000B58D3DA|nr:DUF188 domain-containing protein [Listeria goaensis]